MDSAATNDSTAVARGNGDGPPTRQPLPVENGGHDAKPESQVEDGGVDWATAPWLAGCDGDLGAAFWLLKEALERNDCSVLASEVLARRAVLLQKLLTRLRDERQAEGEPKESENKWTTSSEILDEVLVVASVDAKQASRQSHFVTRLIRDVADVATDVLVARVATPDVELLVRWESHLMALWPELADATAPASGVVVDRRNAESVVGENERPTVVTPPPPLPTAQVKAPRPGSLANIKWQVQNMVAFHRSCANQRRLGSGNTGEVPITATTKWTQEIRTHFLATRIGPEDEAIRTYVTAQIQGIVRLSPLFKYHAVELFGSSLSKFGTRTSDLDMCLFLPHALLDEKRVPTSKPRGRQELLVTSRNDDVRFLKELLDKAQQTVALLNQSIEMLLTTATAPAGTLKRRLLLQHHWVALVAALQHFYDDLVRRESRERANASTRVSPEVPYGSNKATPASKEAVAIQRQKVASDVYALAALLRHYGCNVDALVTRGRVPMVGFTHLASGFECDLTFDNYQACVNTHLLRTYAECDERAGMLGFAIKHWAKCRNLCDSANGFLSSYSYILLTVFFLQTKAHVLPNLQHPLLLRASLVPPVKLNGVDVTFCRNAIKAKAFHAAQLKKNGLPSRNPQSVGELLLSFFSFYAEEFDFSQQVVSVRNPEQVVMKTRRWHGKKLQAWRISIEDPLEPDRDLGSVLSMECQQRIVSEMKRALALLRGGHSFETVVCGASPGWQEVATVEITQAEREVPTTNAGRASPVWRPVPPLPGHPVEAPRAVAAAMANGGARSSLGEAPTQPVEGHWRDGGGAWRGSWRGTGRGWGPSRGRGRGGSRGRGRSVPPHVPPQ